MVVCQSSLASGFFNVILNVVQSKTRASLSFPVPKTVAVSDLIFEEVNGLLMIFVPGLYIGFVDCSDDHPCMVFQPGSVAVNEIPGASVLIPLRYTTSRKFIYLLQRRRSERDSRFEI